MHLTTLHDIKCIYVHNYISISTMNVLVRLIITNHLYISWIRGIYSYQCNISLCNCITMRIRISQTFDVRKYIFLGNEISKSHMPKRSLKIILFRFALWKLTTFKTHNHAFQKIHFFCHLTNFTCNEIFKCCHNTTSHLRVAWTT